MRTFPQKLLFILRNTGCVWLFLALLIPVQATTWEIVTLHGRQYIPLRNLKTFYKLEMGKNQLPSQVRLRGARGVIDFRANSRECAINGVRIWLSFPALSTDRGWMISRMDVAKTIEPAMRPSIIKGLKKVETVVLDPGHGGHDGGAASIYGMEKAFALDIAKRVRKRLIDGGYRVVLTRDRDYFIPLEARSAVANAMPNSIFVSIHFNASPSGSEAAGIEVFSMAPRGAPSTNDNYITWASLREDPGHQLDMASFALGRSIHTAMVGYLRTQDRGLKRARFAVIRTARVPAVLVECGFLTNPLEARRIASGGHRENIARSIAEGINDYALLATLQKSPKNLTDYNRALDTSITLREDHEAGATDENHQPLQKGDPNAPAPGTAPDDDSPELLPFSPLARAEETELSSLRLIGDFLYRNSPPQPAEGGFRMVVSKKSE